MLYTRIATITVQPGKVSEYLHICEQDLLPRYRDLPGFVGYTVAKVGDSALTAFTLWQTRAQAEESVKTSDQWLKDAISKLIMSVTHEVGELPFFAFTGELKPFTSLAPVGHRPL
jgi:antibiotic biosynthesis monooxygenase